MSYLVLSSNGDRSSNKICSPDPDPNYLREASSHGYTPSRVTKSSQ